MDGGFGPAPPPSLLFTKTDVILSLSPPTPGPLAPGQEPMAAKQPTQRQVVDTGGVPWVNSGGGQGMMQGGRPIAVPSRGMGSGAIEMGNMGQGTVNTYQSYSPQPLMNMPRPMIGRGTVLKGVDELLPQLVC
jgi:hypothetical protein